MLSAYRSFPPTHPWFFISHHSYIACLVSDICGCGVCVCLEIAGGMFAVVLYVQMSDVRAPHFCVMCIFWKANGKSFYKTTKFYMSKEEAPSESERVFFVCLLTG